MIQTVPVSYTHLLDTSQVPPSTYDNIYLYNIGAKVPNIILYNYILFYNDLAEIFLSFFQNDSFSAKIFSGKCVGNICDFLSIYRPVSYTHLSCSWCRAHRLCGALCRHYISDDTSSRRFVWTGMYDFFQTFDCFLSFDKQLRYK